MAENLVELTDDNFEQEVLKADTPVLVDFWAEWCGPCRMLAPIVKDIATEQAGKVKVGKLDTDANAKTSAQYGVTAIPTILIFNNGEIVRQLVGVQSKAALVQAIEAVAS